MSKVDELRQKYPSLTNRTFTMFVEGDKTKTKKYLPFMLKTWVNRNNYQISSARQLVNLVQMYDDLLSYIDNKDIYHKDYNDMSYFIEVLNDAMLKREDSTFIKEENINVLWECEKYILLQPKTHKGSLKYGAGTKWCTASRNDEQTFMKYTKQGFLTYLISKKEDKGGSYSKIAFYTKKSNDSLLDVVECYNSLDNNVSSHKLVDNNWDVHDIFTLISIHRANASNWKRVETAKETLKIALNNFQAIDFNSIHNAMKIVENDGNIDYINDVKNKLNEFIQKIPVNL